MPVSNDIHDFNLCNVADSYFISQWGKVMLEIKLRIDAAFYARNWFLFHVIRALEHLNVKLKSSTNHSWNIQINHSLK